MVLQTNLIDTIRQSIGRLKKAERRVADAVLHDIEAATRTTIKNLARAAAVSEPTIVRFARRMGCDGFSDFKLRVSQDHAVARMFVLTEQEKLPSDAGTVAKVVYEAAVQALAHTAAQCDAPALEHAVSAIDRARRVWCFGVGGSSANVAAEAENRLFRFDIAASFVTDSYRQRMAAALADSNDVFLIFSVTGKPRSLVETAATARELGAVVITVTRPKSPLANASTILVPLEILDHEKQLQIPSRTRYGQMFILDCIATMIGNCRLGGSAPKLRRVRSALIAMHGPTDQQPLGD
jgi:RpiR family carbohydrate utilization transcriptional regulator